MWRILSYFVLATIPTIIITASGVCAKAQDEPTTPCGGTGKCSYYKDNRGVRSR